MPECESVERMNPERQTPDAALARPEQLVQYIVPLLVKATKVVRSVGSVGFWVYQSWSVFTPLFVGSGNLLRKKFVSPLLLHRSSIDLKQANAAVIGSA